MQSNVTQGDCLGWLRSMEPNSVDLVFGSPPYEDARLCLENGKDIGIARHRGDWVEWMTHVYGEALRVCRGLVAFVIEGRTKDYSYSGSPLLLAARLIDLGVTLRKPPIFHRNGGFGSGGPDWLRNDYEFIICATNGGKLPWSNNTACGHPPKYPPGGPPSRRMENGDRCVRLNYKPPAIANPGNVIHCHVGKGHMGSDMAHENEAPFPEKLAEFFIRSFCPPGGVVADPFSGSATTLAVAKRLGRIGIGCDIRQSQVDLGNRRLAEVEASDRP